MGSNARLTAYQSLANRLREAILEGRFEAGSRLPGEFELCDQFEASRITVRSALQILEDEMLIERRRGSGTYVSQRPARRIPVVDTDFSGSVRLHAPELRRKVLASRLEPVAAEQAIALGIEPGISVHYARRIDAMNREPVAFDDLFIPVPYGDRLTGKLLREVQFAEAWAAAQRIKLSHVKQSIDAVTADKVTSDLLCVDLGVPLLRETAVYFDATGAALGLFVTHYRADLFRFTSVTAFGSAPTPIKRTKKN